ncbi:MAG: hypothetical protein ACOCZ5_02695, partial [bacterium]
TEDDVDNNWDKLNTLLDVIELEEMSSYNIASINYTREDSDNYEIEVTSKNNANEIYSITKSDFSEVE